MTKIPFEIQTLNDLENGKKIFKGHIERMNESGVIPGTVFAVGLLEQPEPSEHQVALLIEGEMPDDNGKALKFNFFAVIPAFSFINAAFNTHRALQEFSRGKIKQVDA